MRLDELALVQLLMELNLATFAIPTSAYVQSCFADGVFVQLDKLMLHD